MLSYGAGLLGPGANRRVARTATAVAVCASIALASSGAAWGNTNPTITDYAGLANGTAGTPGLSPGTATSLGLDNPQMVAVDSAGSVYIADTLNNLIEKVSPQGILSVIAGDGSSTSTATTTPTTATNVGLNYPQGLAVDSAGNVYIAEGNTIDKVTTDGMLSVIAGNGNQTPAASTTPTTATNVGLGSPLGVAVDAAGNVYIADTLNYTIDELTPSGKLSVIAGVPGVSGHPSVGGGTATAQHIDDPESVGLDGLGNVYSVDSSGDQVEKITPAGVLSVLAGVAGVTGAPTVGAGASTSHLNEPQAVVGDSAGNIYIADCGNNVVEKVTATGVLSIVAGQAGPGGAPTYNGAATASTLKCPYGIALNPDGTLFIADINHNTVDRVGLVTPGAPGQPVPTAGDSAARISFTAPSDNGTSAITSYQVSFDGGSTWQAISTTPGAGSTLTATLTGLTNGTNYTIVVRANNASGAGTASSQASVTPEQPPRNSTTPTTSGTPVVGDTLTASPGTWQGTSLIYGYQWLRDGVAILGATNASYVPTSSDAGHALSVKVTASNAVGSASATSASVTELASAPSSTSTPVAVTIGPVPSTGLTVNHNGEVMLTLVCPISPIGCDASGVLTIQLPSSLLGHLALFSERSTSAAAAATGTVLASFSGEQIASGQSALIAVHLSTAVLRKLQTLRIQRVQVTLDISNHLDNATAVNSTQTVFLLIPPLPSTVCPTPTGQIGATTLGQVTLGRTRANTRRLLRRYSVYSYHTDNYCLYAGRGIRVGYASKRLLGSADSARVTSGGVVFALTSNRFYSLDGVRPGTRLAAAARHLKLGNVIHSGLNNWYVIAGSKSNSILKVRHGIILGVGIVNRQLTLTPSTQLKLLRNF